MLAGAAAPALAAQQCSTAWKSVLNVHDGERGALNVNNATEVWETGDRILGANPTALKQQNQAACFAGDGADPGAATTCRASERVTSFDQLGLLPTRPNTNFDPNDDIDVGPGETRTVTQDLNPTSIDVAGGGTLIVEGNVTINVENAIEIGQASNQTNQRATVIVNGDSGANTRWFASATTFRQADVDVTAGTLKTMTIGGELSITESSNINCRDTNGNLEVTANQRACLDTDGGVFGIAEQKGTFEDSAIRGAYYVDGTQFNMDDVVLQGAATGGSLKIAGSSDATLGELPNTDGFCQQPGPGDGLTAYQMEELAWDGTAGEALDGTGNGHDATAVGDATTAGDDPAIGGDPGTCRFATFDGNGDYLEDPDAGAYLNGLAGITLMAWIKSTAAIGNDNGIFATTDPSGKDNNLGLRYDASGAETGGSNLIRASLNTDQCADGDNCLQVESVAGIQTQNDWHHIAFVWETGKKIRIYIDGTEVETTVTSAGIGVHQGAIDSVEFLRLGQSESDGAADWQGDIDEFLIFDGPLTALEIKDIKDATHPCPKFVDHFAIDHDGTAVTCRREPVTISVHDADHNVFTEYTDVIDLSTSTGHGEWSLISGNGTLINNGDGAGSYDFVTADNGSVTLGLKDTFVEAVNVNVSDGTFIEVTGEDPDLIVDEVGFQVLADGAADAIGTQISGKPSDTAPGAQTLELEAIRTDDDTGACEAAFQDSTTVEMGFECIDPAGCSARQVGIETPAPDSQAIAGNGNGSVTAFTDVQFDFGDADDATAGFALTYPEAGRIRLHARKCLDEDGSCDPAQFMAGASNAFVVRPFAFEVSAQGNPGATAPEGSVYRHAGTQADTDADFDVTSRAVVWQAGDDGNADGRPDAGAALGDNASTPNFADDALLSATTPVTPGIGVTGAIGNGAIAATAFANGEATQSVQYSEVGSVTLETATRDYLGALGVDILGRSGAVGRFIPDQFTLDAAALTDRVVAGCVMPGFTYMDEDLELSGLRLTARAVGATVTRNYIGDFARFQDPGADGTPDTSDDWDNDGAHFGVGAIDTLSATPLTARVFDASIGDVDDSDRVDALDPTEPWDAGTVGSAVYALRLNVDRLAASDADFPDGPYTDTAFGVAPVDPDSVGLASFNLDADDDGTDERVLVGATEIHHGRLAVADTAGSELVDLLVPVREEHFDGSAWVVNELDDCTSLEGAIAEPTTDPDTGDSLDPVTDTCVLNSGGGSSGWDCATTAADDPDFTETALGGEHQLVLRAPGDGKIGLAEVLVELESASPAPAPYLQFDWSDCVDAGDPRCDGDDLHDNDPLGRAVFGIDAQSDRLIIQREPW